MSALAPPHPAPPQQQFEPPTGQREQRRPSAFRKFVGRLRTGSLQKSGHKGSLIPGADDDNDAAAASTQHDGGGLDKANGGADGGNPLQLSPSPPVSPEDKARSRKRSSITHSAAAWTAKMRGAGIGSGADKKTDSAPAASKPADISQQIWSEAYNLLRDDEATASLTSTYEAILSHDVPNYLRMDGKGSLSGQSDNDRAELFSAVAKAGLQKQDSPQGGGDDDVDMDEDDHIARDMLASTKSAVEALLPKYPASGLAWAGLCSMTPRLLDGVIARSDMRGGLIHIIGRVTWYVKLADMLEARSWADHNVFVQRQTRSHDALTNLYRNVLELEMNCVCASASENNAAARDAVSWDGIRGILRDIMRADERVTDTVMQHAVESMKEELQALDVDFKSPEEKAAEEEEEAKKAENDEKEANGQ